MRIFIAYSYRERDQWIEDVVFPLVRAFDSTEVHGKDIQGERLTQEVKERISRCHGLIAFVTRRGELRDDGKASTHRWVTDELAFAESLSLPVLEVRETGVDDQDGLAADRVHIKYDEKNRLDLLLQLASTLARWHRQLRRVDVIPLKHVVRTGGLSDVGTNWLRAQMKQPGFRCQYQVVDDLGYKSKLFDTKLNWDGQRLYFYVNATQLAIASSRIVLHITTNDAAFESDPQNVDHVALPIRFDASEDQIPDPRPRGLETELRVG